MKNLHRLLLIAILAVLLTACGDDGKKLATVGDKTITSNQFDAFMKFKRVPAQDDTKRKAILAQYLEREQLAQAIENTNVLDDKLIAAELNEFRKEMLISRYFEKFLQDKVTDQAVQNYYAAHAANYEERKVHVAHILLRTNRTMSEPERKAKLTTAQEAYSKISAGEPFEKIAQSYSEDKISANKGGELGWLKEGAIDKRFSEKVFSMKPGEVSEPLETAFGFHVIKLIEGPTVVKKPFEAVRGDVRYQLRNEAKSAELKRLQETVKVKQYE